MKHSFFIILFVVLACIPLTNLLHVGLPVTHDGQDHVARIANFYANLAEGTFIPRWAENLNWGYGHPILMFLYPLPSYFASLFHFIGFSLVDSVKLVFGVSFILSGLAMYIWLQAFLPRAAAVVGSLLYVFAPYRFIDLYVRGAIGEHVAFIFPPLVLYFLFKLSGLDSRLPPSHKASAGHSRGNDGGRYWYLLGGSLSLAGLILAHNAISLMFLPIIFFYVAYLLLNIKKKKSLLLTSCFLILFGFALSAFFWLPAFMEGKYTLRDIVTEGSVNDRFVSFQQLLYGSWSYGGSGVFSSQVGLLHWVSVMLSIPLLVNLRKKKDTLWIFMSGLLLMFFFTLFLMTPYSQLIWEKITTLQKFQFPWRFLSLSVFLSAVLGACVFSAISVKTSYILHQKIILIILIILILLVNKDYWHARDYLQKPEIFYSGIYNSTTDTGESAPIWSVRFMEKRPKAHIEVIEGKGSIQELKRMSTIHRYAVTLSERSRIRENTLYFPGWKVFVDGSLTPVEFQDRRMHGIMTFFVEKGKHDVIVKFEETKLRMLADWISGVSLFILLGLGILWKKGKP